MNALQIGLGGMKSGIGGLERYYFGLMHELPAAGTQIQGFVLGDRSTVDSVRCYAAEEASLIQRWSGLRSAIRRPIRDCDLVVSHFALNTFGVLDRIRRRPFVVHFHGPWALESAAEGSGAVSVAAKRALECLVYRQGARFIVLSQAFAAILEHEYGVARELIRIVPGGVDLQRFREVGSRATARRALGWPEQRPTVVTVRRLVRAKGLENLIAAVDRVRHEIPDVLVVIVGTGPLEAELKARVVHLGLERFVRFGGYIPEDVLPRIYRAADLFIVPTVTLEGFGLVVIEALACGTPVLVTPVGGLPEVVTDLEPQLVLKSIEPADIARGMCAALAGRLPLPTDAQCRNYAGRFDWPVIAKRVNAVYREALE